MLMAVFSAALARAQALTDATVTPFVNAVVKVLEAATAVLVALPAAANLKRHTDAETANAVFDLVIVCFLSALYRHVSYAGHRASLSAWKIFSPAPPPSHRPSRCSRALTPHSTKSL
jgi:hypothetical protein